MGTVGSLLIDRPERLTFLIPNFQDSPDRVTDVPGQVRVAVVEQVLRLL